MRATFVCEGSGLSASMSFHLFLYVGAGEAAGGIVRSGTCFVGIAVGASEGTVGWSVTATVGEGVGGGVGGAVRWTVGAKVGAAVKVSCVRVMNCDADITPALVVYRRVNSFGLSFSVQPIRLPVVR